MTLGMALRWYVAAYLLRLSIRLMMPEINYDQARAFDDLAEAMLADPRVP